MKNIISKSRRFLPGTGTTQVVTIIVVALLIGIAVCSYWLRPRGYSADWIVKDLDTLVEIFERIDKQAKIMEFDAQKNAINFLNVGSFKGSQVGPMNLAYPQQWQGPYVTEAPRIQNIDYQVVYTKKGYFITPGDGVQLPNGKIIGKDIRLDENADIEALRHDEKALMYKGKPLALPLYLRTSGMQKLIMENVVDTEEDMI